MKLNFTENDIFEAEFKTSFRGYDKEQVDDFLDKVIEDYAKMQKLIADLENGTVTPVSTQPQTEAVTQVETKEPAKEDAYEELTLDFVRPKKTVTNEVPPLSSLFNFDAEEESADVEELLTVSKQEKTVVESTNYDLIQRLAQLEKEVAALRSKK